MSNMMYFLDLSTASDEERRLIKEILADDSVVNSSQHNQQDSRPAINPLVQPHKQQQQQQHSNQPPTPAAGASAAATTTAAPTVPVASTNLTGSTQSVPAAPAAQMPPMAGDMNSVISVEMNNSAQQPQGYAIQHPPHVAAAFGHPPHVYGGTPIFQPYHYIIPYNLPPYVPYVMPNSVVPPRHQVPPTLASQPPNSTNTHPRSHHQSVHHQQQQHHQHHHPQQQHLKNDAMNMALNGSQNSHRHPSNQHHQQPQQQQHHQHHHPQHQHLKNDMALNGGQNRHRHPSTQHHQQQHHHNYQPHKLDGTISSRQLQHVYSDRAEQGKNTTVEPSEKGLQVSKSPSVNKLSSEGVNAQQSKDMKSDKAVSGQESSRLAQSTSDKLVIRPQHESSPSKLIDGGGAKTHSSLSRCEEALVSKNNSGESDVNNVQMDPSVAQGASVDHNQDNRPKKINQRNTTHAGKTNTNKQSKVSSDEGFDTQSSLDVSKQSHESTSPITNDKTRSPPDSNDHEMLDQKGTGSVWGSASSKSWASLFKRDEADTNNMLNGEVEQTGVSEICNDEGKKLKKPTKNENGSRTTSKERRSQETAKRALDKMAPRLAQKINSINLKHALPFLRLRGFVNKGNGCYINATLQALIACPPFYNLMREIGDITRGAHRENSCTPIMDGFAELFQHFPPPDPTKKIKQAAVPQDQKMNVNNLQTEAMEPKCIYNILGQIKSEYHKGAQEDAEEFLSSVLNSLHEEMIGLSETLQGLSTHNGHMSDVDDSNDDLASDDNLWREVGPKNRSLPIRTAKVINTPIQEIFGGSLFSIRTAKKDSCGHRSPFFDLQLDISGDNVRSVDDAIKSFTALETIHDFYCSKTRQKVDAQRRTSLDHLPPILILHLKQFVYDQDHGLKKLMKKIDYPIDFELPESCLHEKNSNDKSKRSYKLLAVVYHDGKEAIKGHYLTDVYHIGSGQWLRCDDGNLKVISVPRIENPDSTRTPYLLFYRRFNTLLRNPISNYDNRKKG